MLAVNLVSIKWALSLQCFSLQWNPVVSDLFPIIRGLNSNTKEAAACGMVVVGTCVASGWRDLGFCSHCAAIWTKPILVVELILALSTAHTIVGSCTIDHCIMVAFGVREHVRSNVQAPVQHLSLFELSSSSSKCCKLYRAQTFILSRDSIVWFKVQRFQREFCLSGATLRLRSSLWLLSIRTL